MTAGTSAFLIVLGGTVAGVATLTTDSPDAPRIVTAVGQAAVPVVPAVPDAQDDLQAPAPVPPAPIPASPGFAPPGSISRTVDPADRTGPREPRPPAGAPQPAAPANAPAKPAPVNAPAKPAAQTPAKAPARGPAKPPVKAPVKGAAPAKPVAQPPASDSQAPPQPVITTRTAVEKRAVPFQTRFVRDPFLPLGYRKITTAGVPGEQTLRYLVTLTDGRQTARKLVDTTVTRQPQHRVITLGSGRDFDRFDDRDDDCGGRFDFDCLSLGRQAKSYCPGDREELRIELSDLDELSGELPSDLLGVELPQDLLDGELPQMDCAAEPEISRLRR